MLAVVVQQHVVGDVLLTCRQLLFDHGVTPLTDINDKAIVHVRADVAVVGRNGGKRQEAIQLRQHLGIQLHLRHPFAEREHQLLIQAVLDDLYPLLGGGDLLLVLLQLVGDVALCAHQRLLANPLGRHLLLVGVAYLQIIAEDVVEAYLQALYARALDLALLNLYQVVLAIGLDSTQFVQLGVHAAGDDVRSSLCNRRIGHDLALDAAAHFRARVEFLRQYAQVGIVPRLLADLLDGLHRTQRTAQLHHLARTDSAGRDLANDSLQVAHLLQGFA